MITSPTVVTSLDVRDIEDQAQFDAKFAGRTLSPLAMQLMTKRNIVV